MGFVDLCAHLRVRFPGQAYVYAVEAFHSLGHEFVVYILMHKYARPGAADLTLVEQNAQLQAVHSHVPLAVREEDVGPTCRPAPGWRG